MKYPIGTKYKTRYHECTIVDYHITRNIAGEIVKERYVSVHHVMGQLVYDYDVVSTTIAKGLIL